MRASPLLVLALLLAAGCASNQRYEARPLMSDAQGLFARAVAAGPGVSAVLDVEALREIGLIPPPAAEGAPASPTFTSAMVTWMPLMMAATEDESSRVGFARLAVYAALIERWNVWPHLQRLGVLAPAPDGKLSDETLFNHAVILLAVPKDEATNREVLRGFAALGRSFSSAESGGQKPLDLQIKEGRLCIQTSEIPRPVCMHGGAGYYAVGTPEALSEALSAPATAPAKPSPAEALDILRVRCDLPATGKLLVRASGRTSITVEASLENAPAELVSDLSMALNAFIARWDDSRHAARTLVETELDRLKGAVIADADSPEGLKQAAEGLSTQAVLDPDGTSDALRESVQVQRGDRSLRLSAVFPEKIVSQVSAAFGPSSGIAVAGVLGAIALPNFIKYQCRSKQSEAQASLMAASRAQRTFAAANGRLGSFAEIGFEPEHGNRYTYCFEGECLPCTSQGCEVKGPNPCSIYEGSEDNPVLCAYANLNGGPERLDVWLMPVEGDLDNVSSDCN